MKNAGGGNIWQRFEAADPRWLQVGFLLTFLALGVRLDVVPWWEGLLTVGAAAATQALALRLLKLPDVGYLSPVITGLGLALLLRSDLVWLPPLAAALGIAGKFGLRFRGKHLFNPANLGLVLALAATPHAWVSPSQWREETLLLAWFAILGLAVTQRAFRSDISLGFLASWFALKAGRVLYLGQQPDVLRHQLLTGGLIVFAFFMISDPKTTPDHRAGRLLFAAAVASLAFVLQHGFWVQPALFWSLFALAPLTPILDGLFRADAFRWPSSRSPEPPCLSPASQSSLS
jgi:Na+-transporting NADH:ubiquinone oxidoreductase subunit NqrB